MPDVTFETLPTANGKQLGQITLNAPATLNALTLEMVELMLKQLNTWQEDQQIVAVLIRGSGEKAFCAGGDVQQLYRSSVEAAGGPCNYAETFFAREYRLDYLLHTYPKPVIAWGHGIVMGGGLGIFAACNHRVVTETTRIAMPEITIALFPDVGGSYFLNQMPGSTGRFLALTGASVNATDSLYLGLAENAIRHELFTATQEALLAVDWSADAGADNLLIAKTLAQLSEQSSADMPAGVVEPHRAIIEELCRPAATAEVVTAITTLTTDDPWLTKAKNSLAHGSPLSALWIDRQLATSKQRPLKAIFCSELVLSTNIVRHTEFAEGVRALLIDKDKNPQWQFKTIAEVPEGFVDRFFIAPWDSNPLEDL